MIKKIFSESIETKKQMLSDETFLENIEKTVTLITNAITSDNKILIMGNGGSAADAQHFAGEFINRFLMERHPLPAISLSTDTSVLTCIGNDYTFDEIFKKQIEAIAKEGDVLIGITTSGNSANIIEGFKAGMNSGCINIGLLGKDGGKAKTYCNIPIIVSSNNTPRIQEVHITVIHAICELVEKNIFSNKKEVIAIDGPSGAGKSSIAKALSKELGFEYISTGAMYRLIGLLANEKNIFNDNDKIRELCENIKDKIEFKNGKIFFNNQDFTEKVYQNHVSMLASDISKRKVVRKVLGTLQREIGLKHKSVLEGRDIGTVIFPDAKYKFFIDASPEVRAKRRYHELRQKGENVQFEALLKEIIQRDKNDSERELAPLKRADDAVYIDTSNLTLEEVVKKILRYINRRL